MSLFDRRQEKKDQKPFNLIACAGWKRVQDYFYEFLKRVLKPRWIRESCREKGRKKRESDNKQASEIGHEKPDFYSSSDEAKQRSVLSPHSASGEIINSGFILCSGEESSIIFRVERYCESQIKIIKRA